MILLQPCEASDWALPNVHERQQGRKVIPTLRLRGVSGWSGGVGLRGGGDESDTNPKDDKSKGSNDQSCTEDAIDESMDDTDFYWKKTSVVEEDTESSLEYGEDGDDLSDALDEELSRYDNIEDADVGLPLDCQLNEVVDEISSHHEEEGGSIVDTSTANQTDPFNSSILLSEKLALSMNEEFDDPLSEGDEAGQREHYDTDDEEHFDINGKFLKKLDRDFRCSPRMIVRGVYSGEVLQLIMKRTTNGTFVDWTIMNKKNKTTVLLVKGEMKYPYGLSLEGLTGKYGRSVRGGWKWNGYGYGYLALFPGSDKRIMHVDIEESVFYRESAFYHVPGRNCKNINKEEDVVCTEAGCGVRIWGIVFNSFTTAEEEREDYQHTRWRKESQEQQVFLSMVAYFNGDYKIAVHRDPNLQNSFEQNARQVAWLVKEQSADYNDSPIVDQLKISRAEYTWDTTTPKPGRGRVDSTNKVDILTCKLPMVTQASPRVGKGRQGSPRVANGRQRSARVANGHQWFPRSQGDPRDG